MLHLASKLLRLAAAAFVFAHFAFDAGGAMAGLRTFFGAGRVAFELPVLFDLLEFFDDPQPRGAAIHFAGTMFGRKHGEAAGAVDQPDGGFDLVHVLPTGAAAAGIAFRDVTRINAAARQAIVKLVPGWVHASVLADFRRES